MISVIILVKNAADKIEDCLKSVKDLADEIVVLDTGSTDNTLSIVKKYGARMVRAKGRDYASWRNESAKYVRGEWLFYVDHDERVSPELAKEIRQAVESADFVAYDIPRKNYVFGRWLKYGGWWPDRVLRLIKKDKLIGWEGEVHEQPKFRGEMGRLGSPLVHIKEDNLSDMVEKTNRYSEYEAKLLFEAGHPPMAWWRFLRVIGRELRYRLVWKLGILDGPKGIIYCLYQGYSRFITYAKLWEMQLQNQKSKLMKRAAIYNPYLDTGGGGERYVLTFALALKKAGWQVDLQWKDKKILPWLEQRLGLHLGGVNVVEDIGKGTGYDLMFWLSDGSVPFLFAKRNFLHFQTPFHGVGGRSLFNKLKFARINKVICNSEFTKKVIDREYGTKSTVLYPPVNIATSKNEKKENIILFVGRYSQLQQAKGQDVLVDTFVKMCKRGLSSWKLVLIGGSNVGGRDYVKDLKAAVKGYPIEILENLPYKRMVDYYNKAKLFWSASGFGIDEEVTPEKVEHFGITVVEAMAAGCVPLVLAKGGHKEIIKDQTDGILWNTTEELISQTLELTEDERRREEIGKKAREKAGTFSEGKFGEKVLQLVG